MTTRPLVLIFAMAALSLIPFVLLLVTSFVRIAVVLSILKGALGTPQIPPNQVITGLALLLTLYVMAPTGERMYRAVEPVLERGRGRRRDERRSPWPRWRRPPSGPRSRCGSSCSNTARRATGRCSTAWRCGCAPPPSASGITDRDLLIIVPAFLTSELRRAFEIGFLLFVPFLVVDMVIANLLLALGMHMLSPTTVSLPFKLLLFVLADGWQLVLRGLVESYV